MYVAFDVFACVLGYLFLGFYMFKIPLFPRCSNVESSCSTKSKRNKSRMDDYIILNYLTHLNSINSSQLN